VIALLGQKQVQERAGLAAPASFKHVLSDLSHYPSHIFDDHKIMQPIFATPTTT
jgi:hypothetical protein